MKALVGQVPNLPWWCVEAMSNEEIEKFNSGHLVEIEMNKVSEVSAQIKRNEEEHNRIWNAAIEAAAKAIEGAPMFAAEIRKLRK